VTDVVKVVVKEPETVRISGAGALVTIAQAVLPGPPGPPGVGDMQKLVYDPRGFELDVFDLGHMTGVLDAGTF
jgi:hypothetical protein